MRKISEKKKQTVGKNQKYLAVVGSALALSAIIGNLSPTEVLASNPTQTLNFSNSLNSNQSKTLTIPNLVRVQNIQTDNGNVSYSIDGEKLTITVTGGQATGQQYNAQKESKVASNTLSNSTNVFPATNSYSDSNGYSGTVNKSGNSSVISGTYIPTESKTATDSSSSTSNSFPATKPYSSGGFTGTLNKSGAVTTSQVVTGGHYESTGYWVSTPYTTTYCGDWDPLESKCKWTYQQTNYTSEWVDSGSVWVNTYSTNYTQNYSGTVTKPGSDTRVYQQEFNGTVYKAGYDNLYGYNVTVEYVTDITPPADATIKSSNTSPTNKDLTLTITYPSDALVKQYKIGENGVWMTYTSPITLSSNTTVYTRGTDDAGNVSNPTPFVVANIDKVAPVTPSFDVNVSKNTVSFTNLIDVDSDVKEVLYTVNGGAWKTYNGSFELPDGVYTFQVKTVDNATNVSEVATNTSTLYKERLAVALEAVVKTEKSKNQSDVDLAKDLVNKIPNSIDKNALLDRLEEVQRQIDATLLLEKAEASDTRLDFEQAKIVVEKVQNSTEKSLLTDRLNIQEDYLDFIDQIESLVREAESKKTQETVDKALVEVAKLESDDQSPFKDRLEVIQNYLDAIKAVEKATETRSESDVEDAKTKIDLLDKTNPILVDLIVDIEDSFEVADILSLIAKERFDILLPKYGMSKVAYESLVQSYYAIKYTGDFMFVRAGEKFTLVPQNDKYFALVKEQFTNLNVDYDEFVEERIQTQAEIKATSLVKTLEGNYSPTFEKQAQDLVNAVEDLKIRADLQKRLDDAKTKYEASKTDDASKKATESVEKAESSKQTYYITSAYKLVNGLTDDVLKTTLTERLVTLEAQIELDKIVTSATQAVENAERYKSATFVTTAQNKVTALSEGEVKTALQLRLDNLKAGTTITDQSLLVKKAENALSLAQSLKKQTYVDKAQTAIDLVEDQKVKEELQRKLDEIVVK